MRNSKTKKRMSLVALLLIFILILVSCAQDTPPPAGDGAGDEAGDVAGEQAQGEEAGEEGQAPEREVVVLTALLEGITHEGIVETDLDAAILDELGIIVDRTTATNERLALVTAAGDLPDIIHFFDSPDIANTQVAGGTLHPLDDLLERYGQNLLNNIPTALRWSREIVGGGTTYLIPTRTSIADTDNPNRNGWFGNFFTRWDIYYAIGAPEMNNEDEFLEVLLMMMEYQPYTVDGRRTWGLTLWTDWGLWPFIHTYGNAHGFEVMAGMGAMLNRNTMEVESRFIDPDGIFWQSLRFFNKAWNMGVLDPDGFTNQTDQVAEKIAHGEVLSAPANWWTPDRDIVGEDALIVMLPGPFPVFDTVFPRESLLGLQESHSLAISLHSEHPDRAMQLIDWINSERGLRMMETGIQGEDWDIVDGRPQLLGLRRENHLAGTWDQDFADGRGLHAYWQMNVGSAVFADGFPAFIGNALEYMMLGAIPAEIHFATHWAGPDARIPGQAYVAMIEQGLVISYYADDLMTVSLGDPLPEDIIRIINQAYAFMEANIARIVMSADYDEFRAHRDSMIEEMIRMGADTAWEAVQENVEQSRERLELFR